MTDSKKISIPKGNRNSIVPTKKVHRIEFTGTASSKLAVKFSSSLYAAGVTNYDPGVFDEITKDQNFTCMNLEILIEVFKVVYSKSHGKDPGMSEYLYTSIRDVVQVIKLRLSKLAETMKKTKKTKKDKTSDVITETIINDEMEASILRYLRLVLDVAWTLRGSSHFKLKVFDKGIIDASTKAVKTEVKDVIPDEKKKKPKKSKKSVLFFDQEDKSDEEKEYDRSDDDKSDDESDDTSQSPISSPESAAGSDNVTSDSDTGSDDEDDDEDN